MKKTNIDSPFYRTMGRSAICFFANLLWLVCCLPIVTAGASTLGLFTVVNKMAAKEGLHRPYRLFQGVQAGF